MANIFTVNEVADLRKCLQIRREVFVTEQGVPDELEVDEWDDLARGIHVLAVDDNQQPVATARLIPYGSPLNSEHQATSNTGKVQRVAVRQMVRGLGLGRAVMTAIEQLAHQQGYRHLVLDAQCTAAEFYRQLGYQQDSPEIFLDAGIEHVRMCKTLF
ncbi:GNAT family N-acetyltransferase [Alicyclobacillaceae bacterium I2511]|jgi:predicted GNAT family N-acyltransferase|nr:GNAT family N-acetyltransferase [Alicyclobacillaceae bacterium I2511]